MLVTMIKINSWQNGEKGHCSTSSFGDKKQEFQESCYREVDKGAEFKEGW